MIYDILDSRNFIVSNWSGGTTKQLFIYPSGAEYKKLDFLFRISTATVEIENSIFTTLPDVKRKLMILDGKITINNENKYSKVLSVLDSDSFEGSWNTNAVGRCVDFNLMTRKNSKGEIAGLRLLKNQAFDYNFEYCSDKFFIYVFEGAVSLKLDFANIDLKKDNLFVMQSFDYETISFTCLDEAILALVYIF